MTRVPQVIVLGPPGAGKGTQAESLAGRLGLEHISPGEILREELERDPARGERVRAIMAVGELVPDELVDQVVRERLEKLAPEQGFVIDGYPRTALEADHLREMLAQLGRLDDPPFVAWLEVPRDELVHRLRHRHEVEGRADDADEAITRRLATHDAQARLVRRALEAWADVVAVDGTWAVDEVTEEILKRAAAPEGADRHGSSRRSRAGVAR
jgi:adenylate kinase